MAARPPPALDAQARRNLAGLYHAWARAHPDAAKARLASAIQLYETLQPDCALELAGAYAESGAPDKARAIYDKTLLAGVTADPKLLMAQGNYALMKKDRGLAEQVCKAWEGVQGDSAELRAGRCKALNVRAYLLLAAEAPGALAAYKALQAFAREKGLALDAEAEHNGGVAAHQEAVRLAGAARGGGAGEAV